MGNQPTGKILAALHEVMQNVSYVHKGSENTFHHYKYASEGELLTALRPAMIEAGLILIPSVLCASGIDEHGNIFVQVEYTLAHKDGEIWPEKIRAHGAGGDKNKSGVGDKGLYKAITGANKYLLFKLFQIETGDDPERDSANDRAEKKSADIKTENQRQPEVESAIDKKWQDYAKNIRERLSKAKNQKEIDIILTDHDMSGLREYSPVAYDYLQSRGMDQLAAFMTTP